MKYLFQQMLAFCIVIFTIVIIMGISFTRFTRQTLQENTYNQLIGYAESIKENIQYNGLMDTLKQTDYVLSKSRQDVYFLFVQPDLEISYPKNSKADWTIPEKDWKKIKDGNQVKKLLTMDINEEKVFAAVVFYPLFKWVTNDQNEVDSEFMGAIIVLKPISNIDTDIKILVSNFLKGGILAILIALVVGYILAKFQVNRINRMRTATKQIAQGNFDVHLETNGNDELDDLAEDFNQMAVALQISNDEVERQEERRRQFMADAAHEMRTPLTTINGLLEGLAYNAIPENQKEKCIELMQNETKRLIRLVNENLDYEKIRTNQISIMIQKINATKTLQQIVQQMKGKAEDAGDKLELITKEEIDVYADYDRFVQIMVNIIQNAIQFTQNGQIQIKIEKGYLETIISISDTGIGMTEEQVKNIWDRYYKVDPSRKNTKYGESGLGLSIVQQLVKLHHGKIEVQSKINEGTTFTIFFPDVDLTEKENEKK